MEGGRIRSSVALPREVKKPTVVDDNGEQINLKAGDYIYINLVISLIPKNQENYKSNTVV